VSKRHARQNNTREPNDPLGRRSLPASAHWVARVMAVLCLVLLGVPAAAVDAPAPDVTQPATDSNSAAGSAATNSAANNSPATNLPAPVAASRQANNVAIITIHGEIDSKGVMAESVRRRIRTAERAGADAMVFDINTPGGEVLSVLAICKAIRASSIKNTVAWINTDAYSGGAIIAMACREIVVNEAASFGDAMPISISPVGAVAIPDELLKKMLPPLVEEVLTSTRRHNDYAGAYVRDEYLMLSVVANDVELWWVRNKVTGTYVAIDRREFEALYPNVTTSGSPRLGGAPGTAPPPDYSSVTPETIPGQGPVNSPAGSKKLAMVIARAEQTQALASSRPEIRPEDRDQWELLGKISDGTSAATFSGSDLFYYGIAANPTTTNDKGRVVMDPITDDQDIAAFLGAKHIVRLNSNWSEGLVLFLTHIVVRGILIALFLMALFVEMTHPGATFPGIIALVALGALIAPPMLIGMASWWEVAAILVGVVLLGIEVFALPGFGIIGGLGLVSLIGGLIATFIPAGRGLFPDSPGEQSNLMWAAVTVLLAGGTAGIGMYFLARHFGSLPIINRLILKDPGVAVEEESFLAAMASVDDGPAARVGQTGIAITPLRPAGRIQVGEQLIDAVAAFGFIPAGAPIRVVEVSSFRIAVEAVVETSANAGAGPASGSPANSPAADSPTSDSPGAEPPQA